MREKQGPERTQQPTDFAELAGIGPKLAGRIAQLGIGSLEQLELAAHTGRLQTAPGIGPGRARLIREQLEQHFRRTRHAARGQVQELSCAAPLADLLDVDHEYRVKARVGTLPRVAPKRFNPGAVAWLPVLKTSIGPYSYTAFFSNTATAHHLGKARNWVVVLAEREGRVTQYTVVSETRGDWRGQRVVRGRERECRDYYSSWAA